MNYSLRSPIGDESSFPTVSCILRHTPRISCRLALKVIVVEHIKPVLPRFHFLVGSHFTYRTASVGTLLCVSRATCHPWSPVYIHLRSWTHDTYLHGCPTCYYIPTTPRVSLPSPVYVRPSGQGSLSVVTRDRPIVTWEVWGPVRGRTDWDVREGWDSEETSDT